MSTLRAKRKFMHSTSSPAASFCFIALAIPASLPLTPTLSPQAGRGRGPRQREGEGQRLLAAGDRVEVARAFRQAVLVPGPATVLGAEQLPESRDAVDLVRVAGVRRDRHHRRLGLDPVVEAL